MKFWQIVLVLFVSVALSFGVATYSRESRQNEDIRQPPIQETRLDHIKKTGILRCGYINEPPFELKDLNTGKMTGLGPDLMEEIAKQLSIKIDWVGEVSYGQMLTDLSLNKYDMICAPFYALPARSREANLSVPFYYFPAYLYARSEDVRFDNHSENANAPDIKIAVLDGSFSSMAASQKFPKATRVTLPESSGVPELFVEVGAGKADVVAGDPASFANYDKNNPGNLRQVLGAPLQVMPGVFILPAKEQDFKNAIDTTLAYLQGTGFIHELYKKYESPSVKFLETAIPYRNDDGSNK